MGNRLALNLEYNLVFPTLNFEDFIYIAVVNRKKIMATKSEIEINELGELSLKNELYVLPLPSASKAIIVSYGHEIRISCVIPARTYEIAVNNWRRVRQKKKRTIKSPTLLMMASYADIPDVATTHTYKRYFKIYALNNKVKDSVWAAPYMLSNVNSSGSICFGTLRPINLREAYNYFWSAPFNDHLLGQERYLVDEDTRHFNTVGSYIDNYHKEIYARQDWLDITQEICAAPYWACPKGGDAILITRNKELLKQIPKKFWRKHSNTPIIIARARKMAKDWKFESGNFAFTLPHDKVTMKANRRHVYHRYY